MPDRLASMKSDYYDKEQVFVTEFDALEKRKQEAQRGIQREQDEANRKFTLKVAPLQSRIADIEAQQQQLQAAFSQWAQEQKARISVLAESDDDGD